MEWMKFVIELVDKITWPTVIVLSLVILRHPISTLVPLARKLKYKDFEMEFGQELKVVSKKAAGAFPELKHDKRSLLIASAENMPNATILEAWRVVDEKAEALIASTAPDIDLENTDSRYKLMEETLIAHKLVDTKKAKLFSELRQLRNKTAHAAGHQAGKAEAIMYVELCFTLSAHLQRITEKSSQPAHI
ncbi:hypothetical protein [Parendozoicomonas haliclonae]|uniref:DUF4145 domain-containing protein n=1 Tax=Parendozoicomonas haliclonae TaxID=1960125 RepID=A0A1X7APQ2_9GAMM|nr:hypothetical protein [Parendozoicomonas haliclonae]SMA50294.1 hypothetical protein EHSB41UT_04088 [Parendozoicomonas haliclonae]